MAISKKILVSIFSLILICVAVYFYRYKSGHCVCNMMPSNTDAALFINTRKIEKHIIDDVLMNPFSYLKSDHKVTRDSTKKNGKVNSKKINLLDGLNLPKLITICNIKSDDNYWESSAINIKDVSVVGAYLEQSDFKSKAKDNETIYKKGKQLVIVADGKLKFRYSTAQLYSKNNVVTYLKQGDKIFDFINNTDSDIAYKEASGNFVEVNFNDGKISIGGNYNFPFLKGISTALLGQGVAQFSANVDLARVIKLLNNESKEKFENFTKLHVDSLIYFLDGNMKASINGLSTMSDTIKTYEYDDDFNKIEVSKIEDVTALDYNIHVGMTEEGEQYMYNNKAIVDEKGRQVLAIMPLVKTYCELDNSGLNFYTNNRELLKEQSDLKFKFFLRGRDLFTEKANDYFSIPVDLSYFEKVKLIDLTVNRSNEVKGSILINGDRNAVVSIIR